MMDLKKYMDITVTDIVNNAGVARASFYRNFNFDLSIQVQQLFQKFFNDLSRRTETQTFSWTVIDKFNNLGKLIAGNIFK